MPNYDTSMLICVGRAELSKKNKILKSFLPTHFAPDLLKILENCTECYLNNSSKHIPQRPIKAQIAKNIIYIVLGLIFFSDTKHFA